ncbi:MAG TPA: PIN domain-containing protein [Longimicrobium sp.]|nr:PIN domain-containing protein [Longimicrobium sp.]
MEDALTGAANQSDPQMGAPSKVLRVCLDLNVYVTYLRGLQLGHTDTAAQALVAAVRRGESALGPIQLVISWGMLDRLRKVWEEKWSIPRVEADALLSAIAGYAALGPDLEPPHLMLGGTGLIPLRDTEDAHVLDVAVAGRADLLVTSNFKDFLDYRKDVREENRIAIYQAAQHRVVIVHTHTAAQWLREGKIVIP